MSKRKCIVAIAVFVGLFFPARICLASEPGTVIQLSMGLVIMGGVVLFGGGSLSLRKVIRKNKEKKRNKSK